MTDDLETRLREHYRRAAEDIRPDPDVIVHARSARLDRPSRTPWLLAAASVVVIAVAGWAVFRPTPHGVSVTPSVRVAVGVPAATVHPTWARVTGTAQGTARVDIALRVGTSWKVAGEADVTAGRYALAIALPQNTNALRVCAGAICSAPLPVSRPSDKPPTPGKPPTASSPRPPGPTASPLPPPVSRPNNPSKAPGPR